MCDGHEMLAPVLNPFDRMAELARRERDQEILWIELAARPKATANVILDIVDRFLRQPHHGRHGAAVEERKLGGARYDELGAVPFGEQSARLHRHCGHPLHPERFTPG